MKNHLTIFQITDTHLFNNDEANLYGVNTNKTFLEVIRKIKSSKEKQPDIIFLTGDLSQDCTEESYKKLMSAIDELQIPSYWIPGNHDNTKTMQVTFNASKMLKRADFLELPYWNMIFLDTLLKGSDAGYLTEVNLNQLHNYLEALTKHQKPIAIVMHHHPIATMTPLIDEYMLRNNEFFLEMIEKFPLVKLIICGHVHGDYQMIYKNIKIEASPSTCMQWKKEQVL
jgi:Icc protein